MTHPNAATPVFAEDHEALAAFLAAFPGLGSSSEFWKNRFRLWWQDNPAFHNVPAGWILRSGGAIQGFLGNLPSLFQLHGRPTTVYSITSWMVLPAQREQSLALLLEHTRAAEKTLLFDTTPTAEVAQILESMGFLPLPWAGDRESFIVLDWKRCLDAAVPAILRCAGISVLSAAASAPLQNLRLRPLERPDLPAAVESAEVGEEFDRLWQRTSGLYANTNVRTAEALRWHCQEDPDIEKKLFVCRVAKELAGYMILKGRARRGLRTWDCADFWENPEVPGVLESLVATVRQQARSQGLDLLTFPHFNRSLGERLGKAGLFESASGRRALFWGAPELLDDITAENSYFVGLQGDYGTAVS